MNREKILLKITEKWHIKIISVAAALVLTIFYRMNSLETRYLTLPLVVETNNTLLPVNSFAETVRVSLRGESSSIHTILEEDIEAYIDLDRYENEGTFRVPIQIRKSGGALAVDPLEITVLPMEFQITLEQREIRNIPVYPVFDGRIAQGFEMTNQNIVPAYIIAEGPRSSLENQFEFLTDTIDINGRYEDFSVLISIINDNPLITVHGNRMIEYSAAVNPIGRSFNFPEYDFNDDNFEDISENGDDLE